MMIPPLIPRRLAVGILLAILATSGCGVFGDGKGRIKGKVLFKGDPLQSGTVTFVGADGSKVLAAISPDGVYEIDRLSEGTAKIAVVSRPRVPPGFRNLPGSPAPDVPAEKPIAIPPRYNDPEQSGLTCNVKKGEQLFDIDLTP